MCASPISRLTVRDGTQVAYERRGSGSTVVLVHGGFLDHRAWGGLQAILVAAGHTVVAPDRRGHGFSDPYGPRHEVADDAGDLAEIVAAVAEPGTTVRVIAHSSGGHSALAAAALTDSIGDLVLYEPPQRTEHRPLTRLVDGGPPHRGIAQGFHPRASSGSTLAAADTRHWLGPHAPCVEAHPAVGGIGRSGVGAACRARDRRAHLDQLGGVCRVVECRPPRTAGRNVAGCHVGSPRSLTVIGLLHAKGGRRGVACRCIPCRGWHPHWCSAVIGAVTRYPGWAWRSVGCGSRMSGTRSARPS